MTVPEDWGVVIPAYRPAANLTNLVSRLLNSGTRWVVVINDGSPIEDDQIFNQLKQLPNVHYLSHATNQGKGAALKTGFRFIMDKYPEMIGVITADADGQHPVEDIIRVANKLLAEPSALILGVRNFAGKLPWRSWLGNTLTRQLFGRLTGQLISDTQTGLRGIPVSWLPWLIRLSGERYEYELNMLLETKRRQLQIIEQPITTVYEPGNPSSHFHPIIDSWRVYRSLFSYWFGPSHSPLIKLSPQYLKSIATVSDRMPKLYYHPIKIARDFFWLRLAALAQLSERYVMSQGRALDFACGSGIFLPTLSRLFSTVVGIDLEMTEARQLVSDNHLSNIQLIEGDIATIALPGQFDAVFAADVLEHFQDLSVPIDRISQWLQPDGVLLTSLPTEDIFTRLTRLIGRYQKPWDHYHTGQQVEQFLSSRGFKQITRKVITPLWPLYYISVWRKG